MFSVIIIILCIILFALLPIRYPFSLGIDERQQNGFALDYKSTTAMKGIAMLFILVGHTAGTFSTVVFSPLPAAGVSIFLILSGYGLAESYKKHSLEHFWTKKVTRVLIPYAIIITILMLSRSDYSIYKYTLEILGIKTTYWYIAYQIKWYVVFFLVMLLIPQKNLLIFAIISAIMFFTLGNLEREQSIAFVLGAVASQFKPSLQNISYKKIWLILTLSFLTGTLFLGLKQLPNIRGIIGTPIFSFIQMIQNIGFAVAFISIFSVFPKLSKNPFIIYCGVISYELYLIHFPFYGMVEGKISYAALLIVGSLVVSGIFYKINYYISKAISK